MLIGYVPVTKIELKFKHPAQKLDLFVAKRPFVSLVKLVASLLGKHRSELR